MKVKDNVKPRVKDRSGILCAQLKDIADGLTLTTGPAGCIRATPKD